jgi:type I restriction enzyme M protein
MDLATGSAGFLISAMELMIQDAETSYGKKTTQAETKIKEIKANQLLGIELNAEMFTLAATNMILRGDGSSNIQKGNTFNTPEQLYTDFEANRLLLNPPFSYTENGMPFIAFGLDKMQRGGLGAIIIQDSAGSGKASTTNKSILKKHSLIASIKMPVDLFQPMAGVQTSVYILEAHKPHDFQKTVKFIDFRDDGYKRTSRSLQEVDQPAKRYSDIIKIYKAGKSAKIESGLDLNQIYIEDFISDSGNDWNFDQHKVVDTKPTLKDFKKTVSDYLAWEVSNILKNSNNQDDRLGK